MGYLAPRPPSFHFNSVIHLKSPPRSRLDSGPSPLSTQPQSRPKIQDRDSTSCHHSFASTISPGVRSGLVPGIVCAVVHLQGKFSCQGFAPARTVRGAKSQPRSYCRVENSTLGVQHHTQSPLVEVGISNEANQEFLAKIRRGTGIDHHLNRRRNLNLERIKAPTAQGRALRSMNLVRSFGVISENECHESVGYCQIRGEIRGSS